MNEFEFGKQTQKPIKVEFSLYKYDMKEEKEYAVDSFDLYNSGTTDRDIDHPE